MTGSLANLICLVFSLNTLKAQAQDEIAISTLNSGLKVNALLSLSFYLSIDSNNIRKI